jgi:integrase
VNRPNKPRAEYPLFANQNGQWAKKIKGRPYYFGSWKTDPKGVAAEAEYGRRLPAILAGTDSIAVDAGSTDWTVGRLMGEFLKAKKSAADAKERSLVTLGDYIRELGQFAAFTTKDALVKALTPAHFTAYANHLKGGEGRGLGPHARKRVTRYLQAAFTWGAKNGHFPHPNFGTEFVAPDTGKDAMRQYKARNDMADHSARLVTGEELDTMLGRASPNFKAILLLAANAGLGAADLGRLRWRHLDLEARRLDFPRGKTGTPRQCCLWKKTVEALVRCRTLKYTKAALEKDGRDALVFFSRCGLPMYREVQVYTDVAGKRVLAGVKVCNAISLTVGRLAKGIEGVTLYRFRHTLKTRGKKARDAAALNLVMGHRERSTGETYDHEDIGWPRLKRVAKRVYRGYWPVKQEAGLKPGQMRVVGGDAAAA